MSQTSYNVNNCCQCMPLKLIIT